MQITKRIQLDFGRNTNVPVVFAMQGDANSRYIEVEPLMNGVAWTIPDGVTAHFACRKPDGKYTANDYPTISDNIITVPLTAQTLAAHGMADVVVILKNADGDTLTTQGFKMRIGYSPGADESLESSDEIQSLFGLVDDIKEKLENGEFNGNGIESIEKTGSESVGDTAVGGSVYHYSDVYTITFTDGSTTNFKIPRGARWFSGAYSGAGANVTGISLALGAVSGDYFVSTITGNVWMCIADNANSWQYLMCIKGGGDADITAVTQMISEHNESEEAHPDIRQILEDKLDADKLDEAVTDALAEAAASGEFDGADGVGIDAVEQTTKSNVSGGTNVVTVSMTDGSKAEFEVKNGAAGADGSDGKSAYEYAVDGGYAGTEEEFGAKLAEEPPKLFEVTVTANDDGTYTSSHYYADIRAAYDSGRMPVVKMGSVLYPLIYRPNIQTLGMRFGRMDDGGVFTTVNIKASTVTVSTAAFPTFDDIPDISQEPVYLATSDTPNEDGTVNIAGYFDGTTIVESTDLTECYNAFLQGRCVMLVDNVGAFGLPVPCIYCDSEIAIFEVSVAEGSTYSLYNAYVTGGVASYSYYESPSTLPNPNALTINGVAYDGSEAVDITVTGGTSGGDSLLGETPYTAAQAMSVKLVGEGEHSYTAKTSTVADLSIMAQSAVKATLTEHEDYIELVATGGTNFYDAYVNLTVDGLTVGETYVFVVDATGFPHSDADLVNNGYYIVKNSSGTQLGTLSPNADLSSLEFTADTANITVVCYPANNYYWNEGYKTARIGDLYLNEASAGTTRYEVCDKSGTFTDSYVLGAVPAGAVISSDPACYVYSVGSSGGSGTAAAQILEGKTVVCFGDSIFGMYRGDTSAPAYAAKFTGATVHNAGFGGCRMSVHPTTGYAAFSMWALAKAIAENDWTQQDTEAPSGSSYFAEQVELLKSIDFSNVDMAVIHYGTNDFTAGAGVAIDNADDPKDYNTLCGALRYSIEALLGAYPTMSIHVSVPCFRFWTADDGTVTYSDTYTNVNGKTLPEFIDALKGVAREYNLPVIDGYCELGVNKTNAAAFMDDGVHHNLDGRKRFGQFIGGKLISW